MFTITKAVKNALQSLESIYKRATQAPRYNDGNVPTASLTGIEALQTTIKTATVGCKTNVSTEVQ